MAAAVGGDVHVHLATGTHGIGVVDVSFGFKATEEVVDLAHDVHGDQASHRAGADGHQCVVVGLIDGQSENPEHHDERQDTLQGEQLKRKACVHVKVDVEGAFEDTVSKSKDDEQEEVKHKQACANQGHARKQNVDAADGAQS